MHLAHEYKDYIYIVNSYIHALHIYSCSVCVLLFCSYCTRNDFFNQMKCECGSKWNIIKGQAQLGAQGSAALHKTQFCQSYYYMFMAFTSQFCTDFYIQFHIQQTCEKLSKVFQSCSKFISFFHCILRLICNGIYCDFFLSYFL